MYRKSLALLFALVVATPLAAATPSRPAPHWQTTPTMWESGTYTYDGAGNIVSVGTDQYRYDGASRLVNATANTPSHANAQTFQYDIYGNLLRVDMQVTPTGGTPVNTTTVMAIDPGRNQLLEHPPASICPPGVICVSGAYDAAGNQTSSNGYISYEWDALGNLARLELTGRDERYIYDANNERIMTRTAAGNVERRTYALRDVDAKVLRELVDTVTSGTHQWSWTKDYVYRSGSLLAAIAPATAGEAIQHFHLDHLGTPRVITDARGYRLSLHTYLPYGVEAAGSEADGERMKFTGHERDFGGGPGEDLDYMHARYYAPVAGRFLSVDAGKDWDSHRPQSWNLYQYVRGNPIVLTDPTGRVASEGKKMTKDCIQDSPDCKTGFVLKLEAGHEEKLEITAVVEAKHETKLVIDVANGEVHLETGYSTGAGGQTAGKANADFMIWSAKDGFDTPPPLIKAEGPPGKAKIGLDNTVGDVGVVLKAGTAGFTLTRAEVSVKMPVGPVSVVIGVNPSAALGTVTRWFANAERQITLGFRQMAGVSVRPGYPRQR